MPKPRRNFGSLAHFTKVLAEVPPPSTTTTTRKPVAHVQSSNESTERSRTNTTFVLNTTRALHPSDSVSTGHLPGNWAKYDVSRSVHRYSTEADVPEHLLKYFAQRERYFSLYESGCLLDEEGWFSVTPERIAHQIAERCRCDTVLDAFCGVGGNAIALASTCCRVIALDINRERLDIARHNAFVYGVAERIEFVHADYLDFARSYLSRPSVSRKIDVVFLSPPWGGPSYLESHTKKAAGLDSDDSTAVQASYSLRSILPIPGAELFRLSRRITPNIAFFLPRNVDLDEISGLLDPNGQTDANDIFEPVFEGEQVEIEEEFMSGKLKAVTCYFGGLAARQEHLFDTMI